MLFILTANLLDTIQPAFRDRMEVIELSGYTEEEKLAIAKKHLIPKQLNENGLTMKKVVFKDSAIRTIISQYTREAGLRNLEREIGSVCRKVAMRLAEGKDKLYRITKKTSMNSSALPRFCWTRFRRKTRLALPRDWPGLRLVEKSCSLKRRRCEDGVISC